MEVRFAVRISSWAKQYYVAAMAGPRGSSGELGQGLLVRISCICDVES